MRCRKCGHDNPEHVVYCGRCGELVRESVPSPRGHPDGSTSMVNSNESAPLSQIHIQNGPADTRYFSATMATALISVVFFIATIALFSFYYELLIDRYSTLWDIREHPFALVNDVGRAAVYCGMIGQTGMILAMLLFIQGSLAGRRVGIDFTGVALASLSRVRNLILLALAFAASSFCLRLVLMEAGIDLSMDWNFRASGLVSDLQWAAWICVSLALFAIARVMQRMRESLLIESSEKRP